MNLWSERSPRTGRTVTATAEPTKSTWRAHLGLTVSPRRQVGSRALAWQLHFCVSQNWVEEHELRLLEAWSILPHMHTCSLRCARTAQVFPTVCWVVCLRVISQSITFDTMRSSLVEATRCHHVSLTHTHTHVHTWTLHQREASHSSVGRCILSHVREHTKHAFFTQCISPDTFLLSSPLTFSPLLSLTF